MRREDEGETETPETETGEEIVEEGGSVNGESGAEDDSGAADEPMV